MTMEYDSNQAQKDALEIIAEKLYIAKVTFRTYRDYDNMIFPVLAHDWSSAMIAIRNYMFVTYKDENCTIEMLNLINAL